MFRMMVFLIAAALMGGGMARNARADHKESAAIYKAKCSICHAADSSGDNAYGKKNNLRDLRSAEVQKQTDDELKGVIAKGKGKMPGYAKQLSATQVDGLVDYIRDLAKKK